MLFKEILLYLTLVVLFFIDIILSISLTQLKKKINIFFRKGNKDFIELIKNQIKNSDSQKEAIEKITQNIDQLNKISKKTFQKVGIVRFNPFKELGGNQSFCLALLDNKDNGFVITSHYNQQFNRVYIKPITNRKSKYSFSKEEEEAIEKASAKYDK